MEWERERIENDSFGGEYDRPDAGDGDDTCKHGNVTYGEGDCEECDIEQDEMEAAARAAHPERFQD